MPDLAEVYRRMQAQQKASTGGQALTPQQAQTMSYGALAPEIAESGERAKIGLEGQRIANQGAYQQGELKLGQGETGLMGQKEQVAQLGRGYSLQQGAERLAEQQREFGYLPTSPGQQGYGSLWLGQQRIQNQNATAQGQLQLKQTAANDANTANMVKGAIGAPMAALTAYKFGQQSGINDYVSQMFKNWGLFG